SGFGLTGPDASKPGYDFVIQAVSGLMSITGEADGRPTKVGVAISDIVTGLFGAVSILAGLVARGGQLAGQRIDLSLLQSTLAILVNQAQSMFVTGLALERLGNAHPSIVPYETFETADGQIAVGVGSERQWQRLCAALALHDIATDQRFATNGRRVENRAQLIEILGERFATRSSAEWLGLLDAAGVPVGPILDVAEAFGSLQAIELGSRVSLDHPVLGHVDQVAVPFAFSGSTAGIPTPPPLLGEHSAEILTEAGYDAGAIARLVELGVV
ncbi:MAG TPA: CaiB/BaiF CoA-transferase family protein, partial [Candidatus Limnocylindrales bacterium]|nr:CaiB/BaiF CoA-transferase family protein [Candidatus Limnocylindrales bacterium]